jgi:hypothetical protein
VCGLTVVPKSGPERSLRGDPRLHEVPRGRQALLRGFAIATRAVDAHGSLECPIFRAAQERLHVLGLWDGAFEGASWRG